MEDVLKEILYELKDIRRSMEKDNTEITIKIGDEGVGRVISEINRKLERSKHGLIEY